MEAKARAMSGHVRDLTGQRFGRLVVVERATEANDKNGNTMWLCVCDCGKGINARGSNLTSGKTKSCGCLRREYYESLKGRRYGNLHANRKEETMKVTICDCCKKKIERNFITVTIPHLNVSKGRNEITLKDDVELCEDCAREIAGAIQKVADSKHNPSLSVTKWV